MSDRNYRKVYGVDWEVIVEHINAQGYEVIQVGKSPLPVKGTNVVSTSLREMMSIITSCSFFIGIDSGPSHIASSLNIPSLVFFGAVNPDRRHFRKIFKGFFLQQFCEFAGCYHNSVSAAGPDCRLVGSEGVPKCALHSSSYVTMHIDLLINQYLKKDEA
jgi:hypothetical protein